MKKHEIRELEERIIARYDTRFTGYSLAQVINPVNEANWFVHYSKYKHEDIYRVAVELQKRLKMEELLDAS